ncbi:MAG: ABC transporter ATP-binding protein [Chloroflexota bacterium]
MFLSRMFQQFTAAPKLAHPAEAILPYKNESGLGPTGKSLIQVKNVVKKYMTESGEFTALHGINVDVEAGEFVAVIGKSGSGKSTLSNMITGIDRPTAGEIYVNGTAVHALGEGEMARWRGRQIGVIFQFFQLLPMLTVAQNVMLPMDFCNTYPRTERLERAMHLLDLVGLADKGAKFPTALSGGQQQRVAIARALANDPPILVGDEPTGSLDSKTADAVFRMFEELVYKENKTILMVTHDNDLADRVSKVITVSDGRIVGEYVN